MEQTLWFLCPYCGKRLLRYASGAYSAGVYLKCRQCRREAEIRIAPAQGARHNKQE